MCFNFLANLCRKVIPFIVIERDIGALAPRRSHKFLRQSLAFRRSRTHVFLQGNKLTVISLLKKPASNRQAGKTICCYFVDGDYSRKAGTVNALEVSIVVSVTQTFAFVQGNSLALCRNDLGEDAFIRRADGPPEWSHNSSTISRVGIGIASPTVAARIAE